MLIAVATARIRQRGVHRRARVVWNDGQFAGTNRRFVAAIVQAIDNTEQVSNYFTVGAADAAFEAQPSRYERYIDRLGRNAMGVSATVKKLEDDGVRVQCISLSSMDLTSSAGKITIGVVNAVAEFEGDPCLP